LEALQLEVKKLVWPPVQSRICLDAVRTELVDPVLSACKTRWCSLSQQPKPLLKNRAARNKQLSACLPLVEEYG